MDTTRPDGIMLPSVQRDLATLRRATGQAVGSVFFGTMLQIMRENRWNTKFGHGGRGEEIFSAQLHGLLAERMGESGSVGLADHVYERYRRHQSLLSAQRSERGEVPS